MIDFDEERDLTNDERAMVNALREARAAKLEEIKALIAQQLGLAPSAPEVEAEAEAACMRWDADAEMRLPEQPPYTPGSPPLLELLEPLPAKTELQQLLKQHYELGELIMNIHDDGMHRLFGDGDYDEDDVWER